MKKTLSVLLAVLLLLGVIPLSTGVLATDLRENLAAEYTIAGGNLTPHPQLTGFRLKDDKTASAHGGYGWALPRADVNQPVVPYNAYFEVHATDLKTDTLYRFSYSLSGNYNILVENITPAEGGDPLALVAQSRNPSGEQRSIDASIGMNNWEDLTVEFVTNSTDSDYTIRLYVPGANGDGSHVRANGGGTHYIFSDLNLQEVLPDENLARDYTAANGKVTFSAELTNITYSDTYGVSAHGGYGWAIYRYGQNTTIGLFGAAFIIHATGLKPETDYQFGFSNSGTFAIEVSSIASPNGANVDSEAEIRTAVSDPVYTNPNLGINSWDDVTVNFTTNSTDTDYDITLKVKPQPNHVRDANATAGTQQHLVVSDLILLDLTAPAVPTAGITTPKGVAMRVTGTQALRFKFSISKAMLEEGMDGKEIVEYGSIAIRSDYLDGKELVKDGEYPGKLGVGVAYNKDDGTGIWYEDNEEDYVFTAALTNIGLKKDGTTNYETWGKNFSVRTYLVLRDEASGEETVVYNTETVEASIFATINTILKEGNESDQAAVNEILQDGTIQQAFKDWQKAQ